MQSCLETVHDLVVTLGDYAQTANQSLCLTETSSVILQADATLVNAYQVAATFQHSVMGWRYIEQAKKKLCHCHQRVSLMGK